MIVYEGKIRPYYPPYGQTWTLARQGFSSPPPCTGATPSLHPYTGVANPSPTHRGNPFPLRLHRGSQFFSFHPNTGATLSPPPLHRGPFPPPPNRGKQFSSPTQGLPSTSPEAILPSTLTQGQPPSLHPLTGANNSSLPYTGPSLHITQGPLFPPP
jgi:hypothetical protein